MVEIKPKKAKIIGVFSCKGGVGKTTTVSNVGTVLSKEMKNNVLIVDANLTAPNLSVHFGVIDPYPTLHEVLVGKKGIEETVQEINGLDAIYGSMAFDEKIPRVNLNSCLKPLRKKYKLILLDSSPGLGDEVISAFEVCDEIIVLTNPDMPTVGSTLKTFRVAEKYKVPIVGTVINKVLGEDFELSQKEVKEALGWPVLGTVPEDNEVRRSTAEGVPIVEFDSESPAAKEFIRLSEKLEKEIKSG